MLILDSNSQLVEWNTDCVHKQLILMAMTCECGIFLMWHFVTKFGPLEVSLDSFPFVPTTMQMFSLADFLLSKISYRLPRHLYTYVQGVTPLSTDKSVLAVLASYLVIIFSIQGFMKHRQPHKLTTLFQTHNILLSSGSLLVLALMLEEIVPMIWKHGIHHALCAESAWTPVSSHSPTRLLGLIFFRVIENGILLLD